MFKINKNEIFKIYNEINELAYEQLIEISIKKSRIDFIMMEETVVPVNTILGLLIDDFITEEDLIITSFDDKIHLIYECGRKDIDLIPENSNFFYLFKLIEELGDHICQCPALEYVISSDYIKVYIDKPNISLENLNDIKKVFKSQCSIELQKQRPYCLFIREE